MDNLEHTGPAPPGLPSAFGIAEPDIESDGHQTLSLMLWLAALAPDETQKDSAGWESVECLPTPKVIGRFRLDALLGRGAYGAVFRACDTDLGRNVALKIAWPAVMFSAAARRRFVDEPKVAAALDHRNIVKIYDYGWFDAVCYIAYELVEGPTLEQWLNSRHSSDVREISQLLECVASAVHFAHERGIVHRDLKPSNILLRPNRDDPLGFEPVVTDFGLARRPRASGLSVATLTGIVVGTDFYMSPEQAAGEAEIGPQTDVYSLGVILYESITGRRPFDADTSEQVRQKIKYDDPPPLRHWRRDVPSDLVTIVYHCLEKSPKRRYGTAQLLAEDLGRFLRNEPIEATRPSVCRRAVKFVQRNPLLVSLALSAIIGAAVLVAWVGDRISVEKRLAGAEAATKVAEATEREHQYAANIRQASEALRRSGRREVTALLDECRSLAQQPNGCGIEWDFLRAQADTADLTLRAHSSGVRAVRFSPRGDLLASGGKDGRTILWDTSTWTLRRESRLANHDEVTVLEFSADGSHLAVAGESGRVVVYRIGDGKAIFDELVIDGRIFALTWLGERHEIAVGGDGAVLCVIDVINHKRRQRTLTSSAQSRAQQPGHPDEITALAYVASRNAVVAFLTPSTTYFIDPISLETDTSTFPLRDAIIGSACAVSDDAEYLATTSGQQMQVWRADDGSKVVDWEVPIAIQSLRYSTAGALIAACRDGTVYICRFADVLANKPPAARRLFGHVGRAVAVDASAGGEWLASAGLDGEIKLWRHSLNYDPFDVPLAETPLLTQFSPCGRWLATADAVGVDAARFTVFDAITGNKLWTLPYSLATNFGMRGALHRYCSFDPSGDEIAILGEGPIVRVHDARTGGTRNTYPITSGESIVNLWFSSDARWLVLRRAYDDAVLIDRNSSAIADHMPVGMFGMFQTIRGDLWLEVDATRRPILRASPTAPPLFTLGELPERASLGSVSPDGRYLALTGVDHIIYCWDLAHPNLPAKFVGHEGTVVDMCFSADSRTLLSRSEDGAMRFWHMPTRSEILKLGSANERILTMGLHPSGTLLVLGVEHDGRFGLQIHHLDPDRDLLKHFDAASFGPE